jgi:CelD/BcsL family acetyltransferase involved in cellulose biosynthesis
VARTPANHPDAAGAIARSRQLSALSTLPDRLRPSPLAPSAAPRPHRRSGEIDFAVVRDRAGFDALELDWNELFARAGRDTHLFQTFNWNWHWANHYLSVDTTAAKTSLAIVTGRRDGRLIALWPLVVVRGGGLKVVRWMGEPVSQYGDVLLAEEPDKAAVLRQGWHEIVHRLGADAVHLRKVRADADIQPLIAGLALTEVASARAPYLDLGSALNFAQYEKRYSQKARKNRRRLMRRLEEQGSIHIVRHQRGSEARAAALEAIALKRAWTNASLRLAPSLADARFAAFFADVAEARRRPAGCAVTTMRCNGVIASVAIDVTCARRRAAHVIVHDQRFQRLSPGTLLLQEWIRAASAEGIATFDLLAPAYAYKDDWADAGVAVGDYAAGFTWAGRLYAGLYLALLRQRLKAALEALPGLLGRARALWPWRAHRNAKAAPS